MDIRNWLLTFISISIIVVASMYYYYTLHSNNEATVLWTVFWVSGSFFTIVGLASCVSLVSIDFFNVDIEIGKRLGIIVASVPLVIFLIWVVVVKEANLREVDAAIKALLQMKSPAIKSPSIPTPIVQPPTPMVQPSIKMIEFDSRIKELQNIIKEFPVFENFLNTELSNTEQKMSLEDFFQQPDIKETSAFVMSRLDKFEPMDVDLIKKVYSLLSEFICDVKKTDQIKLEDKLAGVDYIFYSKRKDVTEEQYFPLDNKGGVLSSGDRYRIHFTHKSNNNEKNYYAYIYQINYSNGEVVPLFPNFDAKEANPAISEKKYVLPFALDNNKGTEKIYFLAFTKKDTWLEISAQKPEIQPNLKRYIETLCDCNSCFVIEFNHN